MSKSTVKTEALSRIFIPICKIDEEQRLVYGKMTFEAEDSAGEIWDYDGSKPYFEKWSENAEKTSGGKSLGNLRSMHQPIAAGKLTQFIMDDEEKSVEICGKVVDDSEWNKVLEGVYTGFSQGGRYVKRWKDPDDNSKTRYISDPVEVSLVDLPCLPGATFEYIKADGSVELRKFSTKENVMDPTNEQIAARAAELAKAAGDETKWADHLEKARADLVAEAMGKSSETAAPAPSASEDGASTEAAAPASEPTEAEKAAAAAGGEPVEDTDVGGEGAGGELEISPEDAEKNRKAARERLSQVWKTSDGKTFGKCDEAVAHEATLTPTPAPELSAVEAALKAAKGDEPEAETTLVKFVPTEGLDVAKAVIETAVEKGLYSASRALCVLDSVIDLQQSNAWEAEYENDGSSVPAQLAEAARSLGAATLAMCQEEVAEALSSLGEEDAVEVDVIFVECAGGPEFVKAALANEEIVAKVGARNSKKDAASVQKIHDETVELGADCGKDDEGGEADKALEPEALQKRAEKDPVVKHLLERTTAAETEVTKALDGIKDLGEQIKALKSQPAPMAPRTSVVGKVGDNGGTDGGDIDVTKAENMIAELQKTEAGRRTLAEAALRATMAAGGHKA